MSIEVNQRLMFVGLGGTGIKITSELEAMLRREMCGPDGTFITKKYPNLELRPFELPQFIQTVVIDTDAAAVAELEVNSNLKTTIFTSIQQLK